MYDQYYQQSRKYDKLYQSKGVNANQQHYFLFLLPLVSFTLVTLLLSCSPVFTPIPWFKGIVPFSTFYRMHSATFLNAISTFMQSLAFIYTKFKPLSLANFCPYSQVTTRSLSKSFLLPTKSISMCGLPLALTQSSHVLTCAKVSLLVISYTNNAPMALLQYDLVIDLKFSCPAVSQICSLMLLSRMGTVLAPNSTPMVTSWVVRVLFSMNCRTTHDLPTPVSPITMNLNRQLQLFILLYYKPYTTFLSVPIMLLYLSSQNQSLFFNEQNKMMTQDGREMWENGYFYYFQLQSMHPNRCVDYINHPLNKSPSKNTYTFSRTQRFPGLINREAEKDQYQDNTFTYNRHHQANQRAYHYQGKSREGFRQSPYKKKSGSKSPSRSIKKNSRSPGKRVTFQQSPIKYKENKGSPDRKNNQSSRERRERIRAGGYYYPKGIGINKDGKYVVSTYENVKTPLFGQLPRSKTRISTEQSQLGPGYYDIVHKSPGKYVTSDNKNNLAYSFSKSPRKVPEDPKSDPNFGPGMYRTFSEFGRYQ